MISLCSKYYFYCIIFLWVFPVIAHGQYIIVDNTNTEATTDKEGINKTSLSASDLSYIHFMVLPSGNNYKIIKEKLERDILYKQAVSIISKGLLEKGFTVKDFQESIKISNSKDVIQNHSKTPQELFLQNAPPDFAIYVDVKKKQQKNGTQIFLELKAVDGYTGDLIVQDITYSTIRYWDDFSRPISEVLNKDQYLNSFIEQLLIKTQDILMNGRKILFECNSKSSSLLFHQLLNGKSIYDELTIILEDAKCIKQISNIQFTKSYINAELLIEPVIGKQPLCRISSLAISIKDELEKSFDASQRNNQVDVMVIKSNILLSIH